MTETKTKVSEERTAGASYVLSFFTNVMQINHFYANYENLMLELDEKHKGHAATTSPEEKSIVMQYCNNLRYYATQCNIAYKAIVLGVGQKEDQKIVDAFEKVKSSYMVKREEIGEYVTLINSFVMKSIIREILKSSQDIVNELYG